MHVNKAIETSINEETSSSHLKFLINFLKKDYKLEEIKNNFKIFTAEESVKVENFIKDLYYKIKDLSDKLKINEDNILEICNKYDISIKERTVKKQRTNKRKKKK
jgi:hypothetical protein